MNALLYQFLNKFLLIITKKILNLLIRFNIVLNRIIGAIIGYQIKQTLKNLFKTRVFQISSILSDSTIKTQLSYIQIIAFFMLLFLVIFYKPKLRIRLLNLKLQTLRILLSGSIGCGKTSIMALIKPFFYNKFEYKIKTCREISFEYTKNSFNSLQQYTQKQHTQKSLTGYCFDDLGAEKTSNSTATTSS